VSAESDHVTGVCHQCGPGVEPLVARSWGKAPLKLKAFSFRDILMRGQNLQPSLYFANGSVTGKILNELWVLSGKFSAFLHLHFLPCDARSAKCGIAIVSRPSVCPSVLNVDVPWAYRLD